MVPPTAGEPHSPARRGGKLERGAASIIFYGCRSVKRRTPSATENADRSSGGRTRLAPAGKVRHAGWPAQPQTGRGPTSPRALGASTDRARLARRGKAAADDGALNPWRPGTGKTTMANVCKAFIQRLLGPRATKQVAFMHSAARLVSGRTIHSALAVPTRAFDGRSKTLGDRKAEMLAK